MFMGSPVPTSWSVGMFLVTVLLLVQVVSALGEERSAAECDYGITLALSGNVSRAESVFVSLLSHSPRDARALTNLGNLALQGGDPAIALAFYDRAVQADTVDAGILLNRAVALMLLGDEDSAIVQANDGVKKAGGEKEAASLLGLRPDEIASSSRGEDKAADKPRVDKSEIAALLTAARESVPRDSTQAERQGGSQSEEKEATGAWRSAGARSADGNVVADVLYWKR